MNWPLGLLDSERERFNDRLGTTEYLGRNDVRNGSRGHDVLEGRTVLGLAPRDDEIPTGE